MIYEIRTYTVKPGAVPEYEKRFAEAYTAREKYSKLGGMWHTEIGPLNQVIHIWQYESLQQRADIRAAAAKDESGKWPPNTSELLDAQEVDIADPVRNMVEWSGPQQWGELYELRMYTYAPGDAAKAAAAFGEAIEARNAIYPVAGIFTTQQGGNLNRLYQLFPYKSFDHREEVRSEFRRQGVWPPHAEVRPVSQLVRFLYPAAHSPLH
jgi:hypothetical protein